MVWEGVRFTCLEIWAAGVVFFITFGVIAGAVPILAGATSTITHGFATTFLVVTAETCNMSSLDQYLLYIYHQWDQSVVLVVARHIHTFSDVARIVKPSITTHELLTTSNGKTFLRDFQENIGEMLSHHNCKCNKFKSKKNILYYS